jgi:hypothetical protein
MGRRPNGGYHEFDPDYGQTDDGLKVFEGKLLLRSTVCTSKDNPAVKFGPPPYGNCPGHPIQ